MAGERMVRILSVSRYVSRPLTLAIRTSSTSHLAGLSSIEGSSVCFSAGTKRMCPFGIRIRVDMLVWPLIAAEVQGESSHTGRTKTSKNGSFVWSEEAKACRTAFNMSSGSYSGLAMHDAVHRYWNKELMIAPNLTSSRKAEQYVMLSVIGQLRGLPKSSVVVRNAVYSTIRRDGGIAQ